jgi:hypothetical protein
MTPMETLRDIAICLNMAEFVGDLCNLGVLSQDFMVVALCTVLTNMRSLQHIEALKDLIICGGLGLWGTGKGWQADQYTRITQAIDPSRLCDQALEDLSPLSNGKERARRSSLEIIGFFNQRVPRSWLYSVPQTCRRLS